MAVELVKQSKLIQSDNNELNPKNKIKQHKESVKEHKKQQQNNSALVNSNLKKRKI